MDGALLFWEGGAFEQFLHSENCFKKIVHWESWVKKNWPSAYYSKSGPVIYFYKDSCISKNSPSQKKKRAERKPLKKKIAQPFHLLSSKE